MPSTIQLRKDYYTLLDLPPTATYDQIQRAYRHKALICHPDRGGSPSRMKALNEAWSVLGDAEARRVYDAQFLAAQPASPPTSRTPKGRPRPVPAPIEHPITDALFSALKTFAFHLGRTVSYCVNTIKRLVGRG